MYMAEKVIDIIRELGVAVIVGDFDNPGYYVSELNAIYVDKKLGECQHEAVLLHELGHAAKQKNEIELYNATKTMKLKMECEANRFMISYLFQRYIKYTGEEPYRVDYLEFMRQNDIPLKDENIVKEIIADY